MLCSDTIRSWFPTPLYKVYIVDQSAEENMNANQFNGATKGNNVSNGNLYLFRLAETYLLRAEAKFYQGNATGAAEDVNEIRRRANAKKMFTTVTIGDICDERARELIWKNGVNPNWLVSLGVWLRVVSLMNGVILMIWLLGTSKVVQI